MTNAHVDVAVVGTLNLDIVIHVERMPDSGETVMGRSKSERPGGKGANQALAAATVGTTALIGIVGGDDAADRMLDAQLAGGVDVTHVRRTEGISGQAVIEVDDSGANRIIVLSGANGSLTADDVRHSLDAADPRIVLTQLESPREVTAAVAAWCTRNGRRMLLNPSPVDELDPTILAAADPLVVNEHEAAFYAPTTSDDPETLARQLLDVARSVLITLGGDGVIAAADGNVERIAVEPVDVVDTTGAGDMFAGVLAAHLATGSEMLEAVRLATTAATELVAQQRE
ncbi:ribokinase [Gordonia sp. CPCC 205515]|uniref:ribokinase n=1 Tax=Gordonia sp. CPCC 205515 TaxID=3140791 RepID=UPI003AF354F3